MMTPAEKALTIRFLEDYLDGLSNVGCNDLELPDDNEHKTLVLNAMDLAGNHGFPQVQAGKILTQDTIVVSYLIELLRELL